MPIFEFLCKDCRSTFEKLCLSVREAERVRCPRCGSNKTSKLFSPFASHRGGFGNLGGGFGGTCGGSRFS